MKLIKDRGVVVHKEIVTHPFGKFTQIKDLNGNILELAELNDSYNEN
jgi:predicted enzyme related to lactoylglutathione lyase